ncbi:hypothetical protein BHE90_007575 [Fusarium euwallaceae]|uniref:Xylosidase/arabinosidase n=1 Tax=Fusarium euwallaceae TaxID=1147111 RepID=A0A430LQC5_9HYPO|nr:hypothetical protein BHE90_007575 [Fusarium euwallaceae]
MEHSNGRNPVLPPNIHIADPEAHMMPDGSFSQVTWPRTIEPSDISSHDQATKERAQARAMTYIKQHGLVERFRGFEELASSSDPPRLLFAPDAIAANGRHYLYFCCSDDTEGFATGDSPKGPFTNPVRLPATGIDPAIFIDRDGQAYYF